jgi:hypothetical protein
MKTQVRGARLLLSAGIAFTLAVGMLAGARTAHAGGPVTVGLGTAATFAVLAGTPSVENSGPTVVTGNLGIHPAAAVNGFTGAPNGTVIGTIYAADPGGVALQAKADLTTAYLDAEGRTPLPAVACELGGQTFVAGVRTVTDCTMQITGTLTLDGQNDPSSVWIFQAPSDLVTASASSVAFINGGSPCNVFWQVDSSATLGSGSSFVGTILALTSITVANGVNVNGRLLARNGTVTMINDVIGSSTCPGAGPLPSAAPSVPNAAMSPENEAATPWPLVALIGAVGLVLLSVFAASRRSTVRKGT